MHCRQPVQANLYSIIDVGKQPQLKDALLRGQINAINCPHCGYRGMLGSPVLYHDPARVQRRLVRMSDADLEGQLWLTRAAREAILEDRFADWKTSMLHSLSAEAADASRPL